MVAECVSHAERCVPGVVETALGMTLDLGLDLVCLVGEAYAHGEASLPGALEGEGTYLAFRE